MTSSARVALLLTVCICCLGNALAGRKPCPTVPKAFKAADAQMSRMADANLFAGMVYVLQGGKKVLFSKSYGQMFPEWGIDLPQDPRDVRYHIGSVMQLMLAAVAWQQDALGRINVSVPINEYLTAADFNMTEPWCPRVWNDTTKKLQGNCMFPTISELLSHRSGFIDNGVHCRFDPGSWQADWCYAGANGTDFPLKVSSLFALGALRPIDALAAVKHPHVPLQHPPNTTMQDMTVDDIYVAAILEKKLGMPLQAILQTCIFDRIGMTKTFYDASSGNDGVYKDYLPLPGYSSFVSPLSFSAYNMDFDWIRRLTLKGGDVGDHSRSTEGPPYGTFVKMAKLKEGIDPAWISLVGAAGAVVTTFTDMGRWMTALSRHPEKLDLTKAIVKKMFTTGGPNLGYFYAQGTVTTLSNASSARDLGTPWTFYEGNMGYSALQYTEWPRPNDPSKDITASFVTYTHPVLDGFDFRTVASTPATPPNPDPLAPNNGTTTCQMRVKNVTSSDAMFQPENGANGGLPARSYAAWSYFWNVHEKARTPISEGWVPAPHIYCDAFYKAKPIPGLEYYWLGQLVSAALGHEWLQK